MTIEACVKKRFDGISLADDLTNISLLQYADDALFLGRWSFHNAKNLVRILCCFHDVSGLKINLYKSRLYGVGVEFSEVEEIARCIKCAPSWKKYGNN